MKPAKGRSKVVALHLSSDIHELPRTTKSVQRARQVEWNMPQHVPPDAASFSSSAPNGGVAGKAETGKRGRSSDDRDPVLLLVEVKQREGPYL